MERKPAGLNGRRKPRWASFIYRIMEGIRNFLDFCFDKLYFSYLGYSITGLNEPNMNSDGI